ncbi:MAG: (d)CMP kinase [Planctomycetota bacterium]
MRRTRPNQDEAVPGPHITDRLALAARPVRHAVFLSDLHLHGGDRPALERVGHFLDDAERAGAEAFFLLGDVFRAWMGPRSLRDPGLQPFLARLGALRAAGRRVVLLHGNHDFLLGPHLERALGVEVAAHRLDLSLGGLRVRLLHGDALCTDDLGYHRLHRVLRSAPFRALVQALPERGAAGVAGLLLRAASRGTASKTEEEMNIVDASAQQQLAEGLDVLLCGHVHRPRDVRLPAAQAGTRGPVREGRLLVLSDFERTGSHARFADGQLLAVPRDPAYAPDPGPVIAIDGPSGSGKSAVSRLLAARLGFGHLDSGAVYRAFTARALEAGLAEPAALSALARTLWLDVDPQRGSVLLDGCAVPASVLRGKAVSAQVSPFSAVPAVREALLEVQRSAARRARGLVAEGRDMGSVVFPQAVLKVFLDARPEVRASRRLAQEPGEGVQAAQVARAQAERDERDSRRTAAPLKQADDAVFLDSSDLSLEETVGRLLALSRSALASGAAIS